MNHQKLQSAAQARRLSALYKRFHEYLITHGATIDGTVYRLNTVRGWASVYVHMTPPLRPWVKCVFSDTSVRLYHACMDWNHVTNGEYLDELVRAYDLVLGVNEEV